MEGKHTAKRPISATVTSSSTTRTPFTRFVPQAAASNRQALSPPSTTTALEPQVLPPRSAGAATPQSTTTRGPRSIAQLRSLNREEQDALIQGKEPRKPLLQRALSFSGQTSVEGAVDASHEAEEVQMRQLMQGLRHCRYLRTSQEGAKESEDD